jgi:hypothetical protein
MIIILNTQIIVYVNRSSTLSTAFINFFLLFSIMRGKCNNYYKEEKFNQNLIKEEEHCGVSREVLMGGIENKCFISCVEIEILYIR